MGGEGTQGVELFGCLELTENPGFYGRLFFFVGLKRYVNKLCFFCVEVYYTGELPNE